MGRSTRTPGWRALLVPTDPSEPIRTVTIADKHDHGLASLYELLACDYVEHVRGPGCSLWIDEEGALTPRREPNVRIDLLLGRRDGWSIRGPVVITATGGPEGDLEALTIDQCLSLRERLEIGAA